MLGFAKTHGGFSSDALDDIELAVGEALANAAEHGHCDGGWILTSCIHDENEFRIIVRNSGPMFDHTRPASGPATETSTRGFGRRIMRIAMDDVRYESGGRVVKLTKLHATPAVTGAVAS